MRHHLASRLVITLVLAAIGTSTPCAAQEYEQYVQIHYMKSLSADYMEFESRYWKPIHEVLRDRGTIEWWAIWRPWFGARTEFDYVTVTAFNSLEGLDWIGDLPELMAEAEIDTSEVDLLPETEERRNLVRSELWKLRYSAGRFFEAGLPSKYIQLEYHDVHPDRLQGYFWEPDADSFGESGLTAAGFYELLYPNGREYPYSHARLNFYPENLSWDTLLEQEIRSPDVVSSQLWLLQEATDR